jgi:hypothetical protein
MHLIFRTVVLSAYYIKSIITVKISSAFIMYSKFANEQNDFIDISGAFVPE